MSRSRYYADPFFGLFEHPYQTQYSARRPTQAAHDSATPSYDNFYGTTFVRSPAVELTEEGREYVVEAELPGVRKEDLEVRVGEGGKTLMIEGKVLRRGAQPPQPQADGAPSKGDTVAKSSNAAAADQDAESPYSSIFTRTFQLPRPVDGGRVSAKLEHGVLLLRIPQMEERGSVKVNIE